MPDDVDAVELKLYQQVFFDLLNFEGLYIIKQSQTYYTGYHEQAGMNIGCPIL